TIDEIVPFALSAIPVAGVIAGPLTDAIGFSFSSAVLPLNQNRRPDLIDIAKYAIWEIKPFKREQARAGRKQLNYYVGRLRSYHIDAWHEGLFFPNERYDPPSELPLPLWGGGAVEIIKAPPGLVFYRSVALVYADLFLDIMLGFASIALVGGLF